MPPALLEPPVEEHWPSSTGTKGIKSPASRENLANLPLVSSALLPPYNPFPLIFPLLARELTSSRAIQKAPGGVTVIFPKAASLSLRHTHVSRCVQGHSSATAGSGAYLACIPTSRQLLGIVICHVLLCCASHCVMVLGNPHGLACEKNTGVAASRWAPLENQLLYRNCGHPGPRQLPKGHFFTLSCCWLILFSTSLSSCINELKSVTG